MTRVAVGVVLVVAAGAGIWFLRAETMARNTPDEFGSALAVIVRAEVRREPESATLEMARALVNTCRLQVDSTLVQPLFRQVDDDTFRFVLEPDLIESDRRQLRGCLQDARLQHLQLDVLDMRQLE